MASIAPAKLIHLALALVAGSCTSAPSAMPSSDFTVGNVSVSRLSDGVYAAIRTEPLGLAVNSNSLFIINDDHVVVVDAQFTRVATLENIAALRRITPKPVRYVINTHWHDDHSAGNQVYRDSFPGVRFVAHANTRVDMIERARPNRRGQVQGAPPAADRFERLLAAGLGGDSTPATPMERESLTSAVKVIRQYVAEDSGFREMLPDSVFGDRLRLSDGGRVIELRWFGRGNTRGDAVVSLPREGIVATGDLVVAPIPFGFGSYPTEWISVLDSIKALQPRAIVPGHGPVMTDLGYVDRVQRGLRAARDQTTAAAMRGIALDSLLNVVDLAESRDEFAGSERHLRTLFGGFFRRPVVSRLYEETKAPLK